MLATIHPTRNRRVATIVEGRPSLNLPRARVAEYRPQPPSVSAERILRIQGYSDLSRVRKVIVEAAMSMAKLAASTSKPVIAYRHVDILSLDEAGSLELEGGVRLSCGAFPRQLAGCTQVVPFVLTVGDEVPERVIDMIEKGDLLEGLLLETAGWLAIEDATRQFKTWLRESMLMRDHRITSRLGPGYSYKVGKQICMWELEEQPALFATLQGSRLPVTLMSSCAMSPKMSRSGMYGVAPLPALASRAGTRGRAVPPKPN